MSLSKLRLYVIALKSYNSYHSSFASILDKRVKSHNSLRVAEAFSKSNVGTLLLLLLLFPNSNSILIKSNLFTFACLRLLSKEIRE